jgi:hypothetical protein
LLVQSYYSALAFTVQADAPGRIRDCFLGNANACPPGALSELRNGVSYANRGFCFQNCGYE